MSEHEHTEPEPDERGDLDDEIDTPDEEPEDEEDGSSS
jgi:hypothetical protein